MGTRPKKNPKDVQVVDKMIHIKEYQERVQKRHPHLFENVDTVFCKKFFRAETKGQAKRILKAHLIELN